MGYVIGAIFGLALGLGIAFYVTISLVKNSNDVGDSKGTLRDFGTMNVISAQDNLNSCKPSGRGDYILRQRCPGERNLNRENMQ